MAKRNPWKTLKTRSVFENGYFLITDRDVIRPNGKKGNYGLVEFKNIGVGVLALDENDRVLLVGQYRYAISKYSWEICEGGCPVGTSPFATAKRELKEETGYKAKTWTKLYSLHVSNSVTDERAVIFLARDLVPGKAEPEETEDLTVKWVEFTEALKMVQTGEITDVMSVIAILHYDRIRMSQAPRNRTSPKRTPPKAVSRRKKRP